MDRTRERPTVCGVHVKTGVIIGTIAQILAILLAIAVCVVFLTVVGKGRFGNVNDSLVFNETDEAGRLLDANDTHIRFFESTYPIITTNNTSLSSVNVSLSSANSKAIQLIPTIVHLALLGFWLVTIPLLLISLPCERTDLILANILGVWVGVLMAIAQMVIFILRLVQSNDEEHDRAILYISVFVLLASVLIAAVGLIADARWYRYVYVKNGAQCICCCESWPENVTTEGQRPATASATVGGRNGYDNRVIEAAAEEIPIQQFSRF